MPSVTPPLAGCQPLPAADGWLYVSMRYATFAVEVRNGRIMRAPPIARKTITMLGRDAERAVAYWKRRGAAVCTLPDANGPGSRPP